MAPPARVVTDPVLGQHVDDVDRMARQVPTFTNDSEVDGQDALGYIDDLRRVIPGTNWYFVVVDNVLKCAFKEGVLAARAYVGPGLRSATTVIVLSSPGARTLGQVALKCALERLHVSGGGPTDGFSPCAEAYYYDLTGPPANRYFVFVASTTQSYCSAVRRFHTQAAAVQDIWSVAT